jgi:hypothetical protein
MALLYGRTFCRGIEIAAMAGWDTDCNAGNVGTILGVAGGIAAIEERYRKPINDSIVLSGISGYLNILDVPSYAKRVVALSLRRRGEPVPPELVIPDGEIDFDFSLPGSTHNLRLSDPTICGLAHEGGRARILYDRIVRGRSCRVFYKPFYRRADFDDERYMPVFSPTVYPGQKVSIRISTERITGEGIALSPYVRDTSTKEIVSLGGLVIREDGRRTIDFIVPELGGAMVDEIGLIIEGNSPEKAADFGCLYIERFSVTGKANYTITLAKQAKEFGSVTPFSHNHGAWELIKREGEAMMEAMCLEHAEAFTGNYFMRDVVVSGSVVPHRGSSHLVSARVQGARRGYYAGLREGGVAVYRHEAGALAELASAPFAWRHEERYELRFTAAGDRLALEVNGKPLVEATDGRFAYGMAGYCMYGSGRCGFGDLSIREL